MRFFDPITPDGATYARHDSEVVNVAEVGERKKILDSAKLPYQVVKIDLKTGRPLDTPKE